MIRPSDGIYPQNSSYLQNRISTQTAHINNFNRNIYVEIPYEKKREKIIKFSSKIFSKNH